MVSVRMASIQESTTLKISAMAKKLAAGGLDIIDMGVGEPDFDTPNHIVEAGCNSIRMGETHYAPTAGIPELRRAIAEKLSKNVALIDVWNKADAVPHHGAHAGVTLSAKTGAGLQDLRQRLLQTAGWQAPGAGTFMARERHVQALRRVRAHVQEAALHLAAQAQALDLLAEELRLAQNSLAEITGEFSSDDLLGVIFSQFCIGK